MYCIAIGTEYITHPSLSIVKRDTGRRRWEDYPDLEDSVPESSSSMVSSVCGGLTGDSKRKGEPGEEEGQGEGSKLLLLSIINVLVSVISPKETLSMPSLFKILSRMFRFVDREEMSGSSSRLLVT